MTPTPETLELLDTLLAFNTVSARPNKDLILWAQQLLVDAGATVQIISNEDGTKANLFATIGPVDKPGFMLSGHTDVVPVDGQHWTVPAFKMTQRDGRIYGRGSADMKGFVACALNVALKACERKLTTPLNLALSYDEEIGCVGVRSLLNMLDNAPVKPLMCLVGEPTELHVAVGHKGKTACHVTCTGRAGHSALAPKALNAIHLATDMIEKIRQMQLELSQSGAQDNAYEVPYTTLHVSNIRGGVALNIVPDNCTFDMEIRNLAEDDPDSLLAALTIEADKLSSAAREHASEAAIEIDIFNTYPGLQTRLDSAVVTFVQSLSQNDTLMKVAFGTEAGLFSRQLHVPSVVCGPGSMDQGHKPDEFVAIDQLHQCDAMLDRLLMHLEQGILVG